MPELDPAMVKLMFRAAKRGDQAAVRTLVSAVPALVNARETDGSTPLNAAAWKGDAGMVSTLLNLGADVMARSTNDHYGDTPLHAAAHGNQREIVALLIGAGADINAVSCNGRTPLQETEIHKATAAAKVLRESGGRRAGEPDSSSVVEFLGGNANDHGPRG